MPSLRPVSSFYNVKITFGTREGLFQFTMMPSGLCSNPATFKCLMECILNGLLLELYMCYLDDIIVFGKSFDTALEILKIMFVSKHRLQIQLKNET